MKNILRFNLAWACLLVAAFLVLFLGGPSYGRAVPLAAAGLFAGISYVALNAPRRWALVLVIATALLLTAGKLPAMMGNFWMFATDHPLYLASPATIFMVIIDAMLFVLPAFILLMCHVVRWRDVAAALRG